MDISSCELKLPKPDLSQIQYKAGIETIRGFTGRIKRSTEIEQGMFRESAEEVHGGARRIYRGYIGV